MAWIELHQAIWTHRKTFELADILDLDETYAAAHLIRLWTWGLDNTPDGDLSGVSDRAIAYGAGWRADAAEFVAALVRSGWIDGDRKIHDWGEYGGKLVERRKADAERKRNSATHPAPSRGTTNGVPADIRRNSDVEKRTEEDKTTQATGVRARAQSAVADPPKPPAKTIPTNTERAAPKPNKVAEFVTAVKELDPDAPVAVSDRDGAAIKRSTAKPDRLAQAYVAAYRGEWGDDWLRDNLSARFVVERIGGYEAHLRAPPPRPKNGQTAVSTNDLDAQRRRYATTLAGGPGG